MLHILLGFEYPFTGSIILRLVLRGIARSHPCTLRRAPPMFWIPKIPWSVRLLLVAYFLSSPCLASVLCSPRLLRLHIDISLLVPGSMLVTQASFLPSFTPRQFSLDSVFYICPCYVLIHHCVRLLRSSMLLLSLGIRLRWDHRAFNCCYF